MGAADGQEALSIVEANAHIDIIFSDVIMPGPIRSIDFVQRAQQLRPGTAVLFTSGYVQNDVMEEWSGKSDINFLAKPYTIEQLGLKLKYLISVRSNLAN